MVWNALLPDLYNSEVDDLFEFADELVDLVRFKRAMNELFWQKGVPSGNATGGIRTHDPSAPSVKLYH